MEGEPPSKGRSVREQVPKFSRSPQGWNVVECMSSLFDSNHKRWKNKVTFSMLTVTLE